FVLSSIFSDDGRDEMLSKIHEYLIQLGEDVKEGKVDVDKFVINKGLTKNPEEYADIKNQPHVQVAIQMKKKGMPVRVGDTVPYVIVVGESNGLAGRAQHPDELRKADTPYKIDYQYYLSNQVLPPLVRLLSPIDGTDQSRIAACLGLDASKFRNIDTSEAVEEKMFTLESTISNEERFKRCEKLQVQCPFCNACFEFPGLVRMVTSESGEISFTPGIDCQNCATPLPIGSLNNQVLVSLRSHIRKFMAGFSVCDERGCNARTRAVAVFGRMCQVSGCKGTLVPEYTDGMLLTQLQCFKSLFCQEEVVKVYEKNRKISDTQRANLHILAQQGQQDVTPVLRTIEMYIELNARGVVDLGKIWGSMGLNDFDTTVARFVLQQQLVSKNNQDPRSHVPFGGSKSNPGYLAFCGSSADQLLQFILADQLLQFILVGAYHTYWETSSAKAVKLVCSAINKVLRMHYQGIKDEDEYLLKGMKNSGHCEWFGVVMGPLMLRHVDEATPNPTLRDSFYALAGYLFDPRSPVPFGGSKSNPGYLAFCGSSTDQLLQFILVEAYHTYWETHSKKALKLVCSAVNKVLRMHHQGMKDEMDEYLLKGMKKSGHCQWFGAVRVPFTLRHVDEGGGRVSPWSVEFSIPKR
ncbi:DNA-directed DNA polymerase alpha catalytic subunit pol1, partial [Podochytrium sp. JEL0797]